jgi:hypothetical protein
MSKRRHYISGKDIKKFETANYILIVLIPVICLLFIMNFIHTFLNNFVEFFSIKLTFLLFLVFILNCRNLLPLLNRGLVFVLCKIIKGYFDYFTFFYSPLYRYEKGNVFKSSIFRFFVTFYKKIIKNAIEGLCNLHLTAKMEERILVF